MINFLIKAVILCCCSATAFADAKAADKNIAIIGDSYSTGLILNNFTSPEKKLTEKLKLSENSIVWPSAAEYSSPLLWVVKHFWLVLSKGVLDRGATSWPFKLGSNKVLNAAVDGHGIASARQQISRVIDHLDQKYPDTVYMWFPISEICSADITNKYSIENNKLQWQKYFFFLEDRLAKKKSQEKMQVFVLPPLQLSKLMYDADLLDKKNINGSRQEYSCRDLRDRSSKNYFTHSVQFYCPNIFTERKESTSEVATYVQSTRQMLKDLVSEWASKLKGQADLRYVDELESFSLMPEDLAEDCLHFSEAGHAKLAKSIEQKIY